MHELVIVVSDLYLSPETSVPQLPEGVALPGLQQLMRFGNRSGVSGGWRSWLASWLADSGTGAAKPSRAGGAPASIAALAAPAGLARGREYQGLPRGPLVWIATPVHLMAGLSSVHLDPRGVLRLEADDLTTLATDFQRVFHDSGFVLEPLGTGDFLLFGPQMHLSEEAEPARFLGETVVQRGHGSAPALRRLSTEIEMWLHEHPVNDARTRRGQTPVTGLWLWGGGAAARTAAAAEDLSDPPSDIAFGRDAYLHGLWSSMGKKVYPLPQELADVFGYSHARRAVLVIEICPMLHSAPALTLLDALVQIDRRFLHPAVVALRSGKLERIVLLVNDRQLVMRRQDRFKLWRRAPVGLSGLK